MKRLTPESPELRSADLVAENIERLRELFPEAFANEGKIDFDVLRQLLGDRVDDGDERYGLNWHGKRAARQLALTPSTGTLRPCPEESVDWDTTRNIFIEGDNLEVLKLLQKSYAGKVKLIYIDPPYNTGKDFVYPDNFQDSIKNYLEITGQVEGGQRITSNTEASGRFHTDWLNMMYPRLKLAHSLLRPDGVMFVTIDSHEEAHAQLLMRDIFGEDNSVADIVWQKRASPANDAKWFSSDYDTILVFAKNRDAWTPRRLPRTEEQLSNYQNPDNDPRGVWNSATYTCNKTKQERPNLYYPIVNPTTGVSVWPKETAVWKYAADVTERFVKEGRLYWGADGAANFPRIKLFLCEMDDVVPRTVWGGSEAGTTQNGTLELKSLFKGDDLFDSPKPTKLLQRVLHVAGVENSDIVVDFFAGSGSTAHAAMRTAAERATSARVISVQLPELMESSAFKNIAEFAKERLRRAGKELLESGAQHAFDKGFRAYRLDSSSIRPWEANRDTLADSLTAAVDHVKSDRTEDDLLYDIILKHGLDLCSTIEETQVGHQKVRSVGGGAVFACFGSRITAADVEQLADGIAKWRDELAPADPAASRVVFRDSAFDTDVAKTNLAAILKQRGFDERLIVSL